MGDETFRLCSNHVDDMITVSTVPWEILGDLGAGCTDMYSRLCRVCHGLSWFVPGKAALPCLGRDLCCHQGFLQRYPCHGCIVPGVL